jgi:hypothetical protein
MSIFFFVTGMGIKQLLFKEDAGTLHPRETDRAVDILVPRTGRLAFHL